MKMYICKECGHLFEEGEQKTYTEHHPYGMTTADEEFHVCPICGGDYEEAKECAACGAWFDPDDENFFGKHCKSCLLGLIDYDMFKKYLKSDADANGSTKYTAVEDFFFHWIWDIKSLSAFEPMSSFECKSDLFSLYDAYAETDKLDNQFSGLHPFLDKIKAFLEEDMSHFADWYEAQEGKNGSV
jgi:hypothetical protein